MGSGSLLQSWWASARECRSHMRAQSPMGLRVPASRAVRRTIEVAIRGDISRLYLKVQGKRKPDLASNMQEYGDANTLTSVDVTPKTRHSAKAHCAGKGTASGKETSESVSERVPPDGGAAGGQEVDFFKEGAEQFERRTADLLSRLTKRA